MWITWLRVPVLAPPVPVDVHTVAIAPLAEPTLVHKPPALGVSVEVETRFGGDDLTRVLPKHEHRLRLASLISVADV